MKVDQGEDRSNRKQIRMEVDQKAGRSKRRQIKMNGGENEEQNQDESEIKMRINMMFKMKTDQNDDRPGRRSIKVKIGQSEERSKRTGIKMMIELNEGR